MPESLVRPGSAVYPAQYPRAPPGRLQRGSIGQATAIRKRELTATKEMLKAVAGAAE